MSQTLWPLGSSNNLPGEDAPGANPTRDTSPNVGRKILGVAPGTLVFNSTGTAPLTQDAFRQFTLRIKKRVFARRDAARFAVAGGGTRVERGSWMVAFLPSAKDKLEAAGPGTH